MAEDDKNGNGTPAQRDAGEGKGVLIPEVPPEYDPDGEVKEEGFKAPEGGSASTKQGSGLIMPSGIDVPTKGFREYVAGILFSAYSIGAYHDGSPASEKRKRIYEEIGVLEATLKIVRSQAGKYGIHIVFPDALPLNTVKGYIGNLSDVFGIDNLDVLIDDSELISFGDLVSVIPEFEVITRINEKEIYGGYYITPSYMMIANAAKDMRGILSHIVEEEGKSDNLIHCHTYAISNTPKSRLLMDFTISTKTLLEIQSKIQGRSDVNIRKMREILNDSIAQYNKMVNELPGV